MSRGSRRDYVPGGDFDGRVVSRYLFRWRARRAAKRMNSPQLPAYGTRMFCVRPAARGPYRWYVRSFHRR